MIAMAIMVGYSIVTLFLGIKILEKERIRFHPGTGAGTGKSITVGAISSANNHNHQDQHQHQNNQMTTLAALSTWQRRRHDMLLPNSTTTASSSVHPKQDVVEPVPDAVVMISRSEETDSPPKLTQFSTITITTTNSDSQIVPDAQQSLQTIQQTATIDNQDNNEEMELPGRFPTFGTKAFAAACPWVLPEIITTDQQQQQQPCSILARPPPASGEGLSQWAGQVAVGFIMARQAGCKFYLDYGKGIDVGTVLEPMSIERLDWRAPAQFDFCRPNSTCFIAGVQYNDNTMTVINRMERLMIKPNKLAYIPNLRHAYATSESYFKSMNGFRDLNRTLPGFDIEFSMACSLGSLFRLSPRATMYEPTLFTKILPALHAPNTLVITLYIRTGRTENLIPSEATHIITKSAAHIADCAMKIEMERLSPQVQNPKDSQHYYSRIVWMIATDSQYLKTWLKDQYTRENATAAVHDGDGGSGVLPPRSILVTQSRGAHSKPGADPSTADFAEAFLDWYLMGESDAVVADHNGPSFGDTAAFRTARPYYKLPMGRQAASSCDLRTPVFRWDTMS